MKKIFKKFFSKDRINLISENLSPKDLYVLEIGVHKGDFSKKLAHNLDLKKLKGERISNFIEKPI